MYRNKLDCLSLSVSGAPTRARALLARPGFGPQLGVARIGTVGPAGAILPHCYGFGPGARILMNMANKPAQKSCYNAGPRSKGGPQVV
jgi:hypothetical protein